MPDATKVGGPLPQKPPLKRFKTVKIAIIIVAIILIIGGPASFFIYEQQSFDNTYTAVQSQLQLCLDNALKNAVLRTGVQAGKDDITEIAYTNQPEYEANYLYFNDVSLLPSTEQLEEAVARYVGRQLDACAMDLDTDSVTVSTDGGPVTVTSGDQTSASVDYAYTVQSRLFGRDVDGLTSTTTVDMTQILTPVRNIVDHVAANKGIADLGIIKPEGHVVTYVLYPQDKVIVFLVRSDEQKVDGIAHAFLFAVDTA